MRRISGLIAIVGSVVLALPYLFYALIYQGLFAYLWVLLCLATFVTWVLKREQHSFRAGLLAVSMASAGIALTSLRVGSVVLTAGLLLAGGVVFGLFLTGVRCVERREDA